MLTGTAVFRVWAVEYLRLTRDVDPATIRIDTIQDERPFRGLRVRIQGSLGRAASE